MKNLNKKKLSESEILTRVKQGCKVAFELLYRLYKSKVYWTIRSKIDDPGAAEELMQDVFIKIWDKRADLDLDRSFGAYIRCIAYSRIIDYCRKTKRDRQMRENLQQIGTEICEEPMESELSRHEGEFLLNAIEQLSPQRKRIFMLCKLEGKSYEEVSSLIGVSTSTISDHIVKATKTLRNQLIAVNRRASILLIPFFFAKNILENII
jgi:RNA polymerase sigma-70 factor (family 1)